MTWLLIVGVVALLAYELKAAVDDGGTGDLTISQLVWRGSKRTPAIPFLFGTLIGHLFF